MSVTQTMSDSLIPRSANPTDLHYMSEVDIALNSKGHPFAYIMSLATLLFFIVFTAWASVAKLDEVTHGTGQIIPSQRTQEIQNLEGGILETMLVRENEVVSEGQLLAKLSPKMIEATVMDAEMKRLEAEVKLVRLQAELNGEEPQFPEEQEAAAPQLVRDQRATYLARKVQFSGEELAIQAQIEQRNQEVQEGLSRQQQIEDNLRITNERIATVKPLVDQRIYSRLDYLGIVQQKAGLEGDLRTTLQTIGKSRSAVQESQHRLANRQAEIRSAITEEMNKLRSEISSLTQTIASSGDRLSRTELRSPVRGTVKRILINTIGGVIKPGETILELVPLDDTLLVEARIRPLDIAFIKPEQKAVIKISAYDFSIYGGLEGYVEYISADTIEDKRGEAYYQVRLRTKKSELITTAGKTLPIIPGMQATVDIITGEKTVLAYLIKPIIKAKQNALTER